ncbi:MAG: mammalian cell entry domain-containing [Planctomycetota bacterium]|nr:MAG: mammalian cell entry domain-containing [Planctomycetota bacterium]
MNDQRRKEMAIGAFVMVGLGLVAAMFWILDKEAFKPKWKIAAEFGYAGGIREGTPVHMAGKPIGAVKAVTFREAEPQPVVDVIIEIEDQYSIKKDSKLTVGSVGLLGEKILEFSLGTKAAGEIAKDGSASIKGTVPPGLEDLQKTLDSAINDVKGTIVKVNTFLDHLNEEEFQKSLKGAITGIEDVAKKAGDTMVKVDGLIDKADSFVVKADEFAGKANTAMDGVNKIITTADEVVAKLNDLGTKLSTLSDDVTKAVNDTGATVKDLSVSLQENSKKLDAILTDLGAIVKDAKDGKGTLGELLKDDTTARRLNEVLASLKVASDSLTQTSDYLRANPSSVIWGRSDDDEPAKVDWRDRK